MVKNLFVNEMNRISESITSNLKENINSEKINKYILSLVFFIISPVSYKVDFYSLYLNYISKLCENKFLSIFEKVGVSDIELLNYYNMLVIVFKLQKKFYREINNNKITSHEINNISTKINCYSFYLFKNFPHYLLKDKREKVFNIFTDDKIIQKNSFKFISPSNLRKKIANKENFYVSYLYYSNENFKNSNLNKFEDITLYFTSKLIKWKACYLEEEKEPIRCKICEKEIKEKELAMHSFICSHKFEWKDQVTFCNEELSLVLENLNILEMKYNDILSSEDCTRLTPLTKELGLINFKDMIKKVKYFLTNYFRIQSTQKN